MDAEHPALLGAVLDGLLDQRVTVAEDVQAEADGGVDVAVTVRIEDEGAFAALDEDRVGHLQVRGEPRVEDLRPRLGCLLRPRRLGEQLGARLGDRGHLPDRRATTGAKASRLSSPTVK